MIKNLVSSFMLIPEQTPVAAPTDNENGWIFGFFRFYLFLSNYPTVQLIPAFSKSII